MNCFTEIPCDQCGIVFGVPEGWRKARVESKESLYCPNGHSLSYRKSRADELAEKLERERAESNSLREQLEEERRRRFAQVGENTKLRKRIASGVCPCCQRSFLNLQRHMKGKHPNYSGPKSA